MRGLFYAFSSAASDCVDDAGAGRARSDVIETSQGSKADCREEGYVGSGGRAGPCLTAKRTRASPMASSLAANCLAGAGIQVMRGHVDPNGSIAVHQGLFAIHSLRGRRHREADLERQGRRTDRRNHLQAGRRHRVSAENIARLGEWRCCVRISRLRYAGAAKRAYATAQAKPEPTGKICIIAETRGAGRKTNG